MTATQTASPALALAALRKAEASIAAGLDALASSLDQIGLPIERSLARLSLARENAIGRLADLVSDAALEIGEVESLAGQLAIDCWPLDDETFDLPGAPLGRPTAAVSLNGRMSEYFAAPESQDCLRCGKLMPNGADDLTCGPACRGAVLAAAVDVEAGPPESPVTPSDPATVAVEDAVADKVTTDSNVFYGHAEAAQCSEDLPGFGQPGLDDVPNVADGKSPEEASNIVQHGTPEPTIESRHGGEMPPAEEADADALLATAEEPAPEPAPAKKPRKSRRS